MPSSTDSHPHRIAVVGISLRFPGADTPEAFWDNLRNGRESIHRFTREELLASGVGEELLDDPDYVKARPRIAGADLFDAEFFGVNPQEAKVMDPQHRLFLECAWEALERAGCSPAAYPGLIGVYAGSDPDDYAQNNLAGNHQLLEALGAFQVSIGNEKDYMPTQVCYRLDLKGPGINIQTACSTSLVAVHLACQGLLLRECDAAIAGGVSVQVPENRGYLHQEGMIYSRDGSTRTFDADASGTIFGSGCGAVVLKRYEDALADGDHIHAVILGSAINNDGSRKIGYTAPSVEGQAAVIAQALARAQVGADSIAYVEAHGTGTALGDPIEIESLTQAFGGPRGDGARCGIGSVKTNLGHLGAAAGIAGFIKLVLALENGELPPSLHYRKPNPNIDFERTPFRVADTLAPWPRATGPLRAGINSFGIGGTNAHVVVEEAPAAPAPAPEPATPQVIALSARTAEALAATRQQLAGHLRANPGLSPRDVAFTLATGRNAFRHRATCVGSTPGEIADALSAPFVPEAQALDDRPVAFMFPGQGTQFVGMGRGHYEGNAVYRATVDECAAVLLPLVGLDVRDLILGAAGEERERKLAQTRYTQPALFVVEYSCARMLQASGLEPAAMIGHSIGEFVAACVAGVFSPADALGLVAARGRLMSDVRPGAMLAVPLPARGVEWMLQDTGLSLAAINHDALCVVSGATAEVGALRERLLAEGVEAQPLRTSHAFHSAMMDPILTAFEEIVEAVPRHAPRLPFVSNVTGTWITADEAVDPRYWARHLRGTVRFADGMRELTAAGSPVLLEVGPGASLGAGRGGLPTFARAGGNDTRSLRETFGKSWARGVAVDLALGCDLEGARRVPLPTYPFQRKRYWVDAAAPSAVAPETARQPLADWFYTPVWQRTFALTFRPGPAAEGRWLVLGDDQPLTAALVRQLRRHAAQVSGAAPGARFAQREDGSFTFEPNADDDYRRLFDALPPGEGGLTVVQAWQGDADGTAQRRFHGLVRLARAATARPVPQGLRLVVLTRGAVSVHGEAPTGYRDALLPGACRVIQNESEDIRCTVVDLDPAQDDDAEGCAGRVLATLVQARDLDLVACRGGNHWRLQYERLPLPSPQQPAAWVQPGQVILVTGGLGGLGLTTALHCARHAPVHLVLGARSALPAREQWPALLAEAATPPALRRRIEALRQIEALGSTVHLIAADVSDRARFEPALREIERIVGRVTGVIHAAGVPGGGLLALRSREAMEAVLAPKLAGTQMLRELFDTAALDFFVLFSSLTGLVGPYGQVDYAAANCFQDAFAQAHAGHPGWRRCLAIDWEAWAEVGMAAAVQEPGTQDRLMAGAITPAEGMEVLDRAMASGLAQVAVSSRDLPARLREPHSLQAARERERAASPRQAAAAVGSASTFVGARDATEARLVELWEQLLGFSPVGVCDSFFDLGGHSLLAVNLVKKVEKLFGKSITPAEFLECGATIEALARLLQQEASAAQRPGVLVALQAKGSRPPVFCLHAIGGTAFSYARLATALGPDQPFHALQSRAYTGKPPHRSIEDMATHYIGAIRTVQEGGPYRLAGWSFGGLVAYEMARQLQAQGERVELLCLIDSWLIPPEQVRVVDDPGELLELFARDVAALFEQPVAPEQWQAVRAAEPEEVFGMLFAWIPALSAHADGGLAYLETLYKVFVANLTAAWSYAAQPLDQQVLLLGAADLSPILVRALAAQGANVETMCLHGWDYCLAAKQVTEVTIPGDHYTLLAPPHVHAVASTIAEALSAGRRPS
jgi:phthiocerol/phenolphthiocerol synthesis type-I polyketide synthase E